MQNTVNQRIKILRKALKLSQAEFLDALGMSGRTQTWLSRIEQGVTERIDDLVVREICVRLGASYEWLKHGTGDMLAAKTHVQPEPEKPSSQFTLSIKDVWGMYETELQNAKEERALADKLADAVQQQAGTIEKLLQRIQKLEEDNKSLEVDNAKLQAQANLQPSLQQASGNPRK